jgi:uncharacterized membrane protein YdbT with pleckstrin-like domain
MNDSLAAPGLDLVPSVVACTPEAVVIKLSRPPVSRREALRRLLLTTLVVALCVGLIALLARPFATVLGASVLFVGVLAVLAYDLLVETTFVATVRQGELAVERRSLLSRGKSRQVLCHCDEVKTVEVTETVDADSDIRPWIVHQLSVTTSGGRRIPVWSSGDRESANQVAACLEALCRQASGHPSGR